MADSDLIFLGVCERAAYVQDGNTNLQKWNVIGLKNIVLSNIFPMAFSDWQLGLAISAKSIESVGKSFEIEFVNESNRVVGGITIAAKTTDSDAEDHALRLSAPPVIATGKGHIVSFAKIDSSAVTIDKPGIYLLRTKSPDDSKIIGQIVFILVEPPPLTPERVTAIRSEPNAVKFASMKLGCNSCSDKYRVYTALDRDDKKEQEGWHWYENVLDEFCCRCGKTVLDLTILRQNFHALLGRQIEQSPNPDFLPLYEKSSIETIRSKFRMLLDSAPQEEILQVFIKENPIIFHQFPSQLIFSKPPILSLYEADFAIVTPQKELVLIEIEKTTTRLLKKNGGVAAPLNHAFDQVRNWLHVFKEHRLAALDAMKIERDAVSTVRGIVIAGTDRGYDAQHLRKLKGSDYANIRFLTYDDLLYSMDALIQRLGVM